MDPVAMDVSLEEASESAIPSYGSVQSGSDSTDSRLLIRTGGTRIVVFEDEDNNNEPKFNVLGSSKHKAKTKWSYEIIIFLIELQKLVIEYIPQKDLPILTKHKRGVSWASKLPW